MWGILYNWVGETGRSPATTLSEGLENLEVLKILFYVFFGCLVVATIFITFSVLIYSIDIETPQMSTWEKTRSMKFLQASTLIYFIAAWAKIVPFVLIGVFNMSTSQTAHYTCAFLTFALILLSNCSLLARRITVLTYMIEKTSTEGLYTFMEDDHSYKRALRVIVLVNVVWFSLELICAILFATLGDGRAECALTFLVIADMLFQPFDFYSDKKSIEKHSYILMNGKN